MSYPPTGCFAKPALPAYATLGIARALSPGMTTTLKAPRLVKTLTAHFPGFTKSTYVTYAARGTFTVHSIHRFDSGCYLASKPETFTSIKLAMDEAVGSYANP